MKPIKKFSTEMNQPKSILEALDSKALDELIKGMGFNDIHELKKEKNLLSKLEALLKEVNPKNSISEDDAADIEDDINKKAEPKSLEDKTGEKEFPVIDTDEVEDVEEVEEVSSEKDDVDEVEEEVQKNPKATRRIMTFEDFIQEETIDKNVSYRDDEDEEDEAVPVADSADADYQEDEELEETSIVSNNKTVSVVKSFTQFVSESIIDAGPELKDEETDNQGVIVSIATGDGIETAEEIEAEETEIGKTKKREEAEGEVFVTDDQEITKEPETAEDKPTEFGKVVIEGTVNEAKKTKEDYQSIIDELESKIWEIDNTKASWIPDNPAKKEKMKQSYLKRIHAAQKKLDSMNESYVNEGKNSFKFKGRIEDLDSQIGSDYYIETTDDEDVYDVYDASTKKWVGNFNYDGKIVTLLDMPNNIFESLVNEAEIKSDAEFKEYSFTVLKKAFGDEFDETKAQEVIDGLTSKYSGDYGAMVGALQSSLGK